MLSVFTALVSLNYNYIVMENETNGLADSFVVRHTADPALRLELLPRNLNGSRHEQVTEMGAEVRKVESSIAFGTTWPIGRAKIAAFTD